MQLSMSVQVMQSSGIFSLFERSLRYPKWWVHCGLLGDCVVFSSSAWSSVVFGVSVSSSGFVLAVGGFSWVLISVRQCGHARYGSGFSRDRFTAFSGFAKGLLQDGHVRFWIVAVISFFLVMTRPSLNMMGNRVYSVNAFRISRLGMGSGRNGFHRADSFLRLSTPSA